MPIETVSKLLGYSKIATAQIYARVVERKASEDINSVKLKLNEKDANLNLKSKAKQFLRSNLFQLVWPF